MHFFESENGTTTHRPALLSRRRPRSPLRDIAFVIVAAMALAILATLCLALLGGCGTPIAPVAFEEDDAGDPPPAPRPTVTAIGRLAPRPTATAIGRLPVDAGTDAP